MAIKVASNVAKVRDDLKSSAEKFNVGSYLDSSEASSFLSDLPGLKDIISSISGIADKLLGFADMILGFIDKILSYLNLNNILDMLGLRKLFDFVISLVADGIIGLGFSIGIRAVLYDLFARFCINLPNRGYDTNMIESFSLLALIIGLSCIRQNNVFSNTYQIMMNTQDINDLRDEISELRDDIERLETHPLTIYNEITDLYEINLVKTNAAIDALNIRLSETNDKLNYAISRIDSLFAFIGASVVSQLSTSNTGTTDTTIALFEDISSVTSVSSLIKNSNTNLSGMIATSVSNTIVVNSTPIDDVFRYNDTVETKPVLYKDDIFIGNGLYKDNTSILKGVGSNLSIPKQFSNTCNISMLSDNKLQVESNGMIIDSILSSMSSLDGNIPNDIFTNHPNLRMLVLSELQNESINVTTMEIDSRNITFSDKYRYLA